MDLTFANKLGRKMTRQCRVWASSVRRTIIMSPRHQLFLGLAALIMIPAAILLGLHLRAARYHLSPGVQALVGSSVPALDKQLTLDKKTEQYQYNPDAANGIKAISGAGDANVAIGGSKYYGVSLASHASKGQTFTDAATKLSFTLVPGFGQMAGKHEAGHIVYPFSNGQVVYTLKDNGLKEDVVLTKPTDHLSLTYKLDLPSDLQARLLPDGSVGIYSADVALFGNISYGSDVDQQNIAKARTASPKTNLVFTIPAPEITQSRSSKPGGVAKFALSGNTLTLSATGLEQLSYPVSIDPSVVVNSANSFLAGNDEDNNLAIGSSAARGTLADGTLSTGWTSVNTGASGYNGSNGAYGAATLAYDGYLYAIGGGYNNNTQTVSTVSYAQIQSNGTLGAWTVGSSLVGNIGKRYFASAVYNGYLYVIGGQIQGGNGSSDVQYALICTGNNVNKGGCSATPGTVGTWSANPGDNFSTIDGITQRQGAAAVAYNGYVYVFGGYDTVHGTFNASSLFAPVHADGTLGSWATTTAMPQRGTTSAAVYNGKIYIMASCQFNLVSNCTATKNVLIGSIGSGGTISYWNTGSQYGNNILLGSGFLATHGYLYIAGGGGTVTAGVVYAPIYADGMVGTFSSTASLTSARENLSMAEYNNNLYLVGGQPGNTNGLPDTQMAPLDAFSLSDYITAGGGATGSWTSTTSLSANPAGQFSVAANGYVYTMGGCGSFSFNIITGGTCGASTGVYSALICTSPNSNASAGCGSSAVAGSLGTWVQQSSLNTAVYYVSGTLSNGYIYLVGGCTSTNICSGGYAGVQRAQVLSGGTLSPWITEAQTMPTQEILPAVTAYNGFVYVAGGGGSSPINNVYYAQISGTGALSTNTCGTSLTWCTSAATFSTARYAAGLAASNNFLYLVSGSTNTSGGGAINDIQYAPIITTPGSTFGSVGTWTALGTPPRASAAPYTFISDGFLYYIGGSDGSGSANYYSTVSYAPILPDGTLGTWNNNSGFTTGRVAFGAANYNGYIYIVGGFIYNSTNFLTTSSTSQFAQLQNIPHIAHYSQLIDLASMVNGSSGVDPQVTRYVVGGSGGVPATGPSGATVCAQGATSSNTTLSTATCSANVSFSSSITWKNVGRYAFVMITLDDTQTATFPDTNPTTISSLATYFHASPARRLRGGQTFINADIGTGITNQLDTEGSP